MEANQTSEATCFEQPKHCLALISATVAIGIALNFSARWVLHDFRNLSTNDVLGTVMVTLLLGIIPGMFAGILTSCLQVWVFTPQTMNALDSERAFSVVHGAIIAVLIGTLAKRGLFKTALKSLLTGLFVAVITTIIQYGVVLGIAVFLSAYGLTMLSIITSYEAGGIGSQCLAAFLLLKLLPSKLNARFGYVGQTVESRHEPRA